MIYFASNTRAKIPAANGAEAIKKINFIWNNIWKNKPDVPVWSSVHESWRSVVV